MKGITQPYISIHFPYHLSSISIFISIIPFIIRLKLIVPPKGSQSNGPSKGRKLERIRFGNHQLDWMKHPENVYAVHLCIDSQNIFGYCTGYLSMPLDTWTHFVNAVIPKVKLPRYDVFTIFRSSSIFRNNLHITKHVVTYSKRRLFLGTWLLI